MTLAPHAMAIAQSGNIGAVIACFPIAAHQRLTCPRVRLPFVTGGHVRAAVEACSHKDAHLHVAIVRKARSHLLNRLVGILTNSIHGQDVCMSCKDVAAHLSLKNLHQPRKSPPTTDHLELGPIGDISWSNLQIPQIGLSPGSAKRNVPQSASAQEWLRCRLPIWRRIRGHDWLVLACFLPGFPAPKRLKRPMPGTNFISVHGRAH